eukprot:CAMPEP_0181213578 /NCGR_PEP_ID=MMETSP1096-20121128/24981_1 /TAXON_ID=156174 ORGANISM="Chrysochromulina ericina, Strain CCMP281" /NCGR_SAMPLE_ID=MMETSP1096 /ASSEMBLY_ACC=CAM_ASM_000453 /LENGTH=98 /DNA_ID=CAMNT_0023305229 /DNA_START=191 /DNA_END=485 /DNA_ORIENTATION=-
MWASSNARPARCLKAHGEAHLSHALCSRLARCAAKRRSTYEGDLNEEECTCTGGASGRWGKLRGDAAMAPSTKVASESPRQATSPERAVDETGLGYVW